ncbi:NAD(P)/FAD-dependent oxidoreductase [Streptomyces sp. NPDC006923]|uniref:flavin-containing monooxygenase n=1 Tax=Streptomyces sp. NPDC006923 TaxID=3155355 RepID=UPI00340D414A
MRRDDAPASGSRRSVPAIVVGAGPAGLATSWHLRSLGVGHVVLERDTVGATWRSRWDSFTLVTPTWSVRLPGRPGHSGDPDGFLTRDQFVELLDSYARDADLPVRRGVEVLSLRRDGAGYRLATSEGDWSARAVVIAAGARREPRVPAGIEPQPGLTTVHAVDYRRPEQLPPGAVLVVGSGQSGTQIADGLRRAGRRVFLATSPVGRVPRRYRGRDVFAWLRDTGFLDLPTEQAPAEVIRAPQPAVSSVRTLALQQLAREGVTLLGRLTGAENGRLFFAGDLAHNMRIADEFSERFRERVDAHLREHPDPSLPEPAADPSERPLAAAPPTPAELDIAAEGISTLLFCTGMRPDTGWLPDALRDANGALKHERGVTPCPGVHAVGIPWMTHRASGVLYGIGTDAARTAERVRDHLRP